MVLFAISTVVIGLDQWTKAWVRATLPEGASLEPVSWLASFVRFTHVHNTGVAFGMLQNKGNLFVYVTLAVVLIIVFYYRRMATQHWMLCTALGLQLGGSIGNLIDRIARGYVTDFVNVSFFAVFNIADSALVVGALLLGYYALFMERDKPVQTPATPSAQPPAPDESSSEAH